MMESRTDLALEKREKFEQDDVEIKGVRVERSEREENIVITKVCIDTENGARIMNKPRGTYITIEFPEFMQDDIAKSKEVARELSLIIRGILPEESDNKKVLVVGLGNREVTPDSLGPQVVDHMHITRHVLKEFGKYAFGTKEVSNVSGIVPGVMAQTGMESVEIIRGIVKQIDPDCVIVIDALAARSVRRLNSTIQITDTGINPGSGVRNNRKAINYDSIGVPVIAIGIPTVVDAFSIINDAIADIGDEVENEHIIENLSPQLATLFVTPKDIDEAIHYLSHIIAEGLNMAFGI